MKKNGRNKRFLVITLTLLMACLYCGCGKKQTENLAMPENEIILVQRYANYSDGYQHNGCILDSRGNVYSFGFETIVGEPENEDDVIQELKDVYKNSEPVATIDLSVVQKIYNYGMKIDSASELIETPNACDAGQNKIIFHNTTTDEWIVCHEDGDYVIERKDKNSDQVIKIYEHEVEETFNQVN